MSDLQLCEHLTALPGDLTEPQTQDPGKALEEHNSRRRNVIYNHATTETDTKLVEKVLVDVTDILFQELLNEIEKNSR